MEQRWRSRLRSCVKVFALGAVVLFVTAMLLGWEMGVPVMALLGAVVLVFALAVVDGIAAVHAKNRGR